LSRFRKTASVERVLRCTQRTQSIIANADTTHSESIANTLHINAVCGRLIRSVLYTVRAVYTWQLAVPCRRLSCQLCFVRR